MGLGWRLMLVWALTSIPAYGADESVVAVNTNTPGSMTCGIQEAIDSLPDGGGAVDVPVGVHEIRRSIYLRPAVTLRGRGDGSIIRKSAGVFARLAEDVPAGSTQQYVVVEDVALLHPGMGMLVGMAGERPRDDRDVEIDRIEGQRVFLKTAAYKGSASGNIINRGGRAWQPSGELLVARGAALFNAFALLHSSRRSVISNLALDGNRGNQTVAGKELYLDYPLWAWRLRGLPYIGYDSRVENCRIYDFIGVAISLGGRTTVIGCDISNSSQGIHPGAGPYARILQNTIHHNVYGIYCCEGNYGMIISQNHIYANRRGGIDEIGVKSPRRGRPGRVGDHFVIISDNVIYRNGEAGIQSAQLGHANLGPEDFIITGNIVMNNWQNRDRSKFDPYRVPAGIALHNAKRCLIANNRVFDDQDCYPLVLSEPASAGAEVLPPMCHTNAPQPPVLFEPLQQGHYYDGTAEGVQDSFRALISDGTRFEHKTVIFRSDNKLQAARWHDRRRAHLDEPLQNDYAAGARLIPEKTQMWGIFVGGPESEHNVAANNICVGNAAGGILWEGAGMQVNGNVGNVARVDPGRDLSASVYPDE